MRHARPLLRPRSDRALLVHASARHHGGGAQHVWDVGNQRDATTTTWNTVTTGRKSSELRLFLGITSRGRYTVMPDFLSCIKKRKSLKTCAARPGPRVSADVANSCKLSGRALSHI